MPRVTVFTANPRAKRAKRAAKQRVTKQRATRTRPARRNPVIVLSKHALQIRYLHAQDRGAPYVHTFARGVWIELLPDGSARLFRPDGKPVYQNFD